MSTLEFNEQLLSLKDRLHYFALGLTRNVSDAEDLLQDSFLKALMNREKFVSGTNFTAWMYTIVRNTFINQHRRTKRGRKVMEQAKEVDVPVIRMHQEHGAISEMTTNEIRKNVDQLPAAFRTPLMMNADGYHYKEIADTMNIPIGTVKSRIFQARKRLMGSMPEVQPRA